MSNKAEGSKRYDLEERTFQFAQDVRVFTIVIYTTDNGPNQFSWPDAATTPFCSEKDTNWEGAFRVPSMVRWPGHIKPGQVSNEMFSGLDWFPTLLAAACESTVKDRLLTGANMGGKTFKVIWTATTSCRTSTPPWPRTASGRWLRSS